LEVRIAADIGNARAFREVGVHSTQLPRASHATGPWIFHLGLVLSALMPSSSHHVSPFHAAHDGVCKALDCGRTRSTPRARGWKCVLRGEVHANVCSCLNLPKDLTFDTDVARHVGICRRRIKGAECDLLALTRSRVDHRAAKLVLLVESGERYRGGGLASD